MVLNHILDDNRRSVHFIGDDGEYVGVRTPLHNSGRHFPRGECVEHMVVELDQIIYHEATQKVVHNMRPMNSETYIWEAPISVQY